MPFNVRFTRELRRDSRRPREHTSD